MPEFARRDVESYFVLVDEVGLDYEFRKGDDRVPTHRAVTLVVQEEDVKVSVRRGSEDGAVHVCMTTWLPHQTGTQVIVAIPEVPPFFEYSPTFNRRQAIDDDAERLTTGMHIDRGDTHPVFRGLPVSEMVHPQRILAADTAD